MRECCSDRTGKKKKKYLLKEDALEVARSLWLEKSISVKVYQCEDSDGWHLTSRDAPKRSLQTIAKNTRNNLPQSKKRKGRAISKILGEELVDKIKDEVHKRNAEKSHEVRKRISETSNYAHKNKQITPNRRVIKFKRLY